MSTPFAALIREPDQTPHVIIFHRGVLAIYMPAYTATDHPTMDDIDGWIGTALDDGAELAVLEIGAPLPPVVQHVQVVRQFGVPRKRVEIRGMVQDPWLGILRSLSGALTSTMRGPALPRGYSLTPAVMRQPGPVAEG